MPELSTGCTEGRSHPTQFRPDASLLCSLGQTLRLSEPQSYISKDRLQGLEEPQIKDFPLSLQILTTKSRPMAEAQ